MLVTGIKIFVSHASQDRALARDLVRGMPGNVEKWIDEKNIKAGDDIGGAIALAIKSKCNVMLLLITEHSVVSGWVRRELRWALAHERKLGRKFVIPVLHGGEDLLKKIGNKEFRKRCYIRVYSQTESQIATATKEVGEALRDWFPNLSELSEVGSGITQKEQNTALSPPLSMKERASDLAYKVIYGPQSGYLNWRLTNEERKLFQFWIPKEIRDDIDLHVDARIKKEDTRQNADRIFEKLKEWMNVSDR